MDRHTRALFLLFLTTAGSRAATYVVLDVQKVPLTGDSSSAVVRVTPREPVQEVNCDVLVAGAGLGGIGTALALTARGHSVCLTEETDWVGGQATAGGVSALDENRFIEFAGGTRSYMSFREQIREWYRANRQLSPRARESKNLNPGSCYVSPLCFEPRVGAAVLDGMLRRPKLEVYRRTAVLALERKGPRIESALVWQFDRRAAIRIRTRFVLDATEMGDLLPMAGIPYVAGSEAKADTQEPDAADAPNHACVQSFTYPFALERGSGPATPASPPPGYDAIVERQGFSLRVYYPEELGWKGWIQYRMYGDDPPVPNNMSPGPFFPWRRLLDSRNFASGVPRDVALINWPRQDYAAESPLDREPGTLAAILQRAKQTSQAFLCWLQKDYPELALRPDVMDTADGMAKYPYIRESRRILARIRVAEQDIVEDYQPGPRARWFADSVGAGFYMVDIHPCGNNEKGRMRMPRPFQIPMGALLPRTPLNFLPAGKNLGVTHLTNGAFRLHPVEWNVGEAAGTIAALWLEIGAEPAPTRVQEALARAGVPMVWFDDLGVDDPAFAAIQLAALRGIYPLSGPGLHASPDAPVTRAEAAAALAAYFGEPVPASEAPTVALRRNWMAADHRNWFHPDLPFYWTDWREDRMPRPLPPLKARRTGPVRRSEMAARLAGL